MANNMRSFVKFIRPEKGNRAGVGTVVEVKDRDIAKLVIPASADHFYFYDASINPKDGHMNESPVYIIARRMLTREEAKLLIQPDVSKHGQIGWDKRLEENDTFVLTRSGNIEPVGKFNIVIDANKKQIYPALAPKLPAPPVKMELDNPVEAPPAATFRPRPKAPGF